MTNQASEDKLDNTQPNLSDIVKGTPKGNKAVQEALVGAARDQEATKSLAELDKILKQNFSGNYEISCTRCSESIDISYKPSKNAKQDLLDWHNMQALELLDRLENGGGGVANIWEAIEAERNKLKESRHE